MSKSKLEKPTADQVFLYTHIIRQNPRTDQKEAMEALQQWLDGTLEAEVPDAQVMSGSTDQCLACIAGCCGFFGCNPYCLAACVAGVCK